MDNNNVFKTAIQAINSYLSARDKKRLLGLIGITFVGSLLDVFGLASILPVVKMISDPKIIQTNYYVHSVYTSLGFNSISTFILAFIFGVFIFFIVKNAALVGLNYMQFGFTARISLNMIARQFDKYYNVDFWNYKNLGAARVLNYVTNTPEQFTSQILNQILLITTEGFVSSIIIIGIAVYQPVLFLLLACLLAPTTWLSYASLRHKQKAIGEEQDEIRSKSYSILHDAFFGYIDIKLADKQHVFHNKYMSLSGRTKELNILKNVFNLLPQKLMETVAILGIVLIVVYSFFFQHTPSNTITILGLFVAAAYRLLPSANRILQYMMNMKQSQYTIRNMNLFAEEDKKVRTIKQQPLSFNESICFDNVGYTFPDGVEPVLRNITFRVNKGEKIGFMGSTGCGKTTLMNLLLRFYKETEGRIMVDGKKLDDTHLRSWWDNIGYVRQDVYILEGTIKDNIILGDDEVDEERLWQVIRSAQLIDFVESMEDGVDTFVGEKGNRLSGGQRQRIAIARALYRNVEILVFDEATSALDNKTEQEVTDAINNISDSNITVFVVAHRLTTLRDCNKIYEMEHGCVIRERTYQELNVSMG